jgi:hypothetical protein
VPFLGSDAPQNHPVHFVLRDVRVGGRALPLASAAPVRAGERVTFDRGAVQEVYDLRADAVEQTFVVASDWSGDVEVEIEVRSDLVENAAEPGIQFGNERGQVSYGQAHVVRDGALTPVATTCEGRTIRIHVPAALRGSAPLVIDPIIHTSAFTFTGGQPNAQPDVAYDASTDQYLIVWEYQFSAADIDVYSEFRNGDGTAVQNSLGIIDSSTVSCAVPRVANLNQYDRFLVVMQRYESARWQIYGRLRLAATAPHPIVFPISEPTGAGHCINADIGGDSSVSGAGDNFLVVWQRELSTTDYDIHARLVRADTSLATGTIPIENSAASIYSMPAVSQSNGNGYSNTPRWLVAYQFRFNANDWDIYGAALSQNGTITTPNSAIDTAFAMDLVPSVSTPNTAFANGNPLFLVTYERQNPFAARAKLLSGGFVSQIPPVDLSASFGLGGFWARAESDGNRFVVTTGAGTISVATLAYTGSALVLHDAPHALTGAPSYPRLCSKHSGGGPRTDYAVVHLDENTTPDRVVVAAYRGHAPAGGLARRVMGCNGLGIDVTGRPFLGEGVTFSLSNVGFDIGGFAFGAPVPASNTFCGVCPLGFDLATVVPVLGNTLSLPLPTSAGLVGASAAVQGFGLGTGPCAASLRYSDTIDLVVQ